MHKLKLIALLSVQILHYLKRSVALCRAEAVRAELPFPVAELPPPGAEARQFHAGRGEDHLRDVQQEGKLVSLT